MPKYLGRLTRFDPEKSAAIQVLKEQGIRTNLDLLEAGFSPEKRKIIASASGLAPAMVDELVNMTDLSRMPWASKATISNIIGAGYGSLKKLSQADPERLYADFFLYGKSIGKNLKLGNEIENSHRIAKIVPSVL